MSNIAAKGRALTAFALDACDHFGLTTSTPRDPDRRGCHVAVHVPEAKRMLNDLATRKVVADMRPPDILRLGLSPLTTRFVDVWDGLRTLAELL
jgi:kynureninase